MSKLHKLLRIVVVLLAAVLIIQVKNWEAPSWAAPGQDVERQTVPTRTPTPKPATATPKPATPKPATPVPSSPTDTPTSPTPDTTLTPGATLTAMAAEQSGTGSSGPFTLPDAGGPNLLMWAEAFLLVAGVLLLLTGSRADRRRR